MQEAEVKEEEVKLAGSVKEVSQLLREMIGMQLVTPQTGRREKRSPK
jgi:hypothetical protein